MTPPLLVFDQPRDPPHFAVTTTAPVDLATASTFCYSGSLITRRLPDLAASAQDRDSGWIETRVGHSGSSRRCQAADFE
jgi:hypothetical protein